MTKRLIFLLMLVSVWVGVNKVSMFTQKSEVFDTYKIITRCIPPFCFILNYKVDKVFMTLRRGGGGTC